MAKTRHVNKRRYTHPGDGEREGVDFSPILAIGGGEGEGGRATG